MESVSFKALRESYGETLCDLGNISENIVVLDADLSKSTRTSIFSEKFPNRFFNCGIAESNMMGVAAGLASTGKIVFASSFAMFAVERAFEIIRNSIGYPRLNVKIVATHSGISVGEDGASHQCCEDISLMRSIPSMNIISPSDHIETKAAVKAAIDIDGPVYIRLGRSPVPVFNTRPDYKFEFGKGQLLEHGDDVTIISTGSMTYNALEAHKILKLKNINARVINIHTIKPIDKEIILNAAANTKLIVTVEEHSVIGGLGSAVCDVVCDSNFNVPVTKIGINDVYGMSGQADKLLEYYGLSTDNIVDVTLNRLSKMN